MGEYGGWFGVKYDFVVICFDCGEFFGGVLCILSFEVLEFGEVDVEWVCNWMNLLS